MAASRWWCISAAAGSERGSAERAKESRTPEAGAKAEAGKRAEVGREALQFKTTNLTVRTVSARAVRTVSARAATERWRPLRCCPRPGRVARNGVARRGGAAREEGEISNAGITYK